MKLFKSLQKVCEFFIDYEDIDLYGRPSFTEAPPLYNKTYNKSPFPNTVDEVNNILKKYLFEESSELIRYNLRNLDDLEVLNLGSLHTLSDISDKFKSKLLKNDVETIKKRILFSIKNLTLQYCPMQNYEPFTSETRPKSYWIAKLPTTSSELSKYLLRFKETNIFNEDYTRYRFRKLAYETKLIKSNHLRTMKKISIERNFQCLFNDLTYIENNFSDLEF